MSDPSLLAGPVGWASPRVAARGNRARRVELNAQGHQRQHFLLRAEAVTLSEAQVARMSEYEAHCAMEAVRFAETNGVPQCPHEGCRAEGAYRLTITRQKKDGPEKQTRYKCRECRRTFTLTSGTIFANRKKPIRDLLLAHIVFVNAASGKAALALRRSLACSYKTAFVWEGKTREAIAHSRTSRKLEGVIEVDGTNIGGHSRKGVEKKKGRETRVGDPSPQGAMVAIRERSPNGESRIAIFASESAYRELSRDVNGKTVVDYDFVRDHAKRGSHFVSDCGFEFGYLGSTDRVNHSVGFKVNGVHNNGIESLFARFKRAKRGVHYGFSLKYADLYGEEVSWREDYRRRSNGEQFQMLLHATSHAPVSSRWRGYWQRWRTSDSAISRRRRPLRAIQPLTA